MTSSVPRPVLRHDRRSDDSGYGTIGRQGRREEKRRVERDGDGTLGELDETGNGKRHGGADRD